MLSGDFDVVVCDGFAGNILLKFAEAVGGVLLNILKEELPRGVRGKVGSTVLMPNLKRIKQRVDHAEHGGGLLLGVAGVCIISHGSSDAASFANAIRQAQEAVENQVLERMAVPIQASKKAAEAKAKASAGSETSAHVAKTAEPESALNASS